jgi:hypothetical protein
MVDGRARAGLRGFPLAAGDDEKKLKAGARLPPLLLLVLYNGVRRWMISSAKSGGRFSSERWNSFRFDATHFYIRPDIYLDNGYCRARHLHVGGRRVDCLQRRS